MREDHLFELAFSFLDVAVSLTVGSFLLTVEFFLRVVFGSSFAYS